MPSRTWQQVIIASPKKNSNANHTMVMIRKTGYANVWINDRHIYWNYNSQLINPPKVDFDAIVQRQQEQQQTKKKQIILVRRT